MGRKPKEVALEFPKPSEEAMRRTELEGARGRKRDHMREWRADPQHRQSERVKRQHLYFRRKVVRAKRARYVGTRGQRLCGICGVRRPVEIIERLRVSEADPSGFVRVLIPYCGHC